MKEFLKKPEQKQVCKIVWACNFPDHNHMTEHVAQVCISKNSRSYCKEDYIGRSRARKLEAFRLRYECGMTYKDIGATVGRLDCPDTPVSIELARSLVTTARRLLVFNPEFYGHEYCKYLSIEDRNCSGESYAHYLNKKDVEEKTVSILESTIMAPIDILQLSARAHNCLLAEGITLIGDLINKRPVELLKIINLGKKSFTEINDAMARLEIEMDSRICVDER